MSLFIFLSVLNLGNLNNSMLNFSLNQTTTKVASVPMNAMASQKPTQPMTQVASLQLQVPSYSIITGTTHS